MGKGTNVNKESYQSSVQNEERGKEMVKTGTLYPLLAAMEDRGFLSSRTASLSGRERKFYRTTEQGKEYLLQQTERWYKWEAFTNKILER